METHPTTVTSILDQIQSESSAFTGLKSHELVESLEPLAKFLCWAPYKQTLEGWLKKNGGNDQVYLALIKAHLLSGSDLNSVKKVFTNMVTKLGWGYSEVSEHVISHISGLSDLTMTAFILEELIGIFDEKSDKIECLERLSGIYEKKLFDDKKLHSSFEKIRKIEPTNINALKYFKSVAIQNSEWVEATQLLSEILDLGVHQQVKYRAAHELATIQLYQLDTPQDAIKTLESHCKNSPLDASTLHYDAYHRIGDVEGCLGVLKNSYDGTSNSQSQAVLALRIGELFEQSGGFEDAFMWLQKSKEHNPDFQVVSERLINLSIRKQDWKSVSSELKILKTRLNQENSKEKVDAVLSRINELTGLNVIG